jgi:hypothetical protein
MTSLGVGFHKISKAEYLMDPCERPSLTASIAKRLITRTPKHAWDAHPRFGARPYDPTEAMRRGLTVDSLLLGADQELVMLPLELPDAKGAMKPTNDERRMESAKAWVMEQEAAGRMVVKRSDLDECRATATSVTDALARNGVKLHEDDHQVTAVWESNGVLCRCRFDNLHIEADHYVINELKTTEDASHRAITRTVENFGYDIQAAAYQEAVETIRPDLAGRGFVRFIFAETTSPYEPNITQLAGSMAELGRRRWARAVATWGKCLATNEWPGYPFSRIEASSFALEREESERDL